MAVSTLQKTFGGTTIETTEADYKALVRESEQLRILKNLVALEEIYSKEQIKTVIKAMEANNE